MSSNHSWLQICHILEIVLATLWEFNSSPFLLVLMLVDGNLCLLHLFQRSSCEDFGFLRGYSFEGLFGLSLFSPCHDETLATSQPPLLSLFFDSFMWGIA
jgi:hypothetical protein